MSFLDYKFIIGNTYELEYMDHQEHEADYNKRPDLTYNTLENTGKFRVEFTDPYNIVHVKFIIERIKRGKEIKSREIDVMKFAIIDIKEMKYSNET